MGLELGAACYKILVPQEDVQISLYSDVFAIHCNLHGVRNSGSLVKLLLSQTLISNYSIEE